MAPAPLTSHLHSASQHADIKKLAAPIRALAMDAVEAANSGHPGMPMGMADVATVLFTQFLKFSASTPEWPDRDRFVLSAGHGSMLLYALGYLLGYEGMTIEEIKKFRTLGSHTAGHPEYNPALGIETTTGPLGQGFANAVGLALAEKLAAARLGEDVVQHYTYCIAGDGCLMEGISYEAAALAGHLQLNKLIVLFDDNGISIDGKTDLATSEDQPARFRACGWHVQEIDGHNPEAIAAALKEAQKSAKPSLIACKTTIAYGAPTKAGTSASHGSPLGATEIAATREAIEWPYEPFVVPEDILQAWSQAGKRGEAAYAAWQQQVAQKTPEIQEQLRNAAEEGLPLQWAAISQAVAQHKKSLVENKKAVATRKASGDVLEVIAPLAPELIGGSADLTGSVNTKVKVSTPVTAADFSANYVHYGVREHAMAAIMNGLALHKGFIPYSGTFLVFSDYCKPAIRLSALMEQRVIYVFTHDSIGLGEDGPTHQPIEHLAALRAVPNLQVFRPADAVEVAECWLLALANSKTPSVLSLTRQNLPILRESHTNELVCAFGGYILRKAMAKPQVTVVATGSEVEIAVAVQEKLQQQGIATAVVSMPCQELFLKQSKAYQNEVLPDDVLTVSIEAASTFGWQRFTGRNGLNFGIDTFGASAPYKDLYKHFGLEAEQIAKKVASVLTQSNA